MKKKDNFPQKRGSLWLSLSLAWQLGYLIIGPLIIFVLGGQLLDKILKTSPLFLLLGIIIAFSLTTVGIYFKLTKILKIIEREAENKNPEKGKK